MTGSGLKAQGAWPVTLHAGLALAAFALATVAAAGLAAAQPPPGQARPGQAPAPSAQAAQKTTTGTSALRGQVVAADSGAALARASITVQGEGAGVRRITSTDGAGRWEVKQLPAGRYTVTAAKPPWVTIQSGQRSGIETGKPIELADGQTVEKVDFRLPRGGVIAGRVVDDLGEPAAFLRVNAMRLRYANGRRQLVRVGITAQTDDIGHYRLYGLPAGTYYIATDGAAWGGAGVTEDVGLTFAPTYYPGTAVAADAQAVTVRAGQERPGTDFGQVPARLVRVSGIVVDQEGAALSDRRVQLLADSRKGISFSGISSYGSLTGPDGRWSVTHVPPGEYFATALPVSSSRATRDEIGYAPVTVSGQDVDGLVVRTTPGARVAGRIEFEGGDPPAVVPGVRVAFEEPDPGVVGLQGAGEVRPDWTFEVTGISPGERVLRVAGLPAGLVVKSANVDGSDLLDVPWKFDGTENLDGVQVLVTRRPAEVSGGVGDDQARPVRDYAVAVYSTDTAKWRAGSRFLASARPDQGGRYRVAGLPPGEYWVVALEYLSPGESEDPEFLGPLRAHATRITLGEGEMRIVELKLAPR